MIALPSIAFGGFSGSAKGVTARQVGGRSVLSVKCWPTGPATGAQLVRRTSLKKISKSYQLLSDSQMQGWERLAEHTTGQTVLGEKSQISGINLYVRLNVNRVMAGESILSDAPLAQVAVPNVAYREVVVSPELVIFAGIRHEPSPFKLVVKMSGNQSHGVSSGWSKTVIIASDVEDDWGEADVTQFYLKTIGVESVPGQKVFIESYWLDTSTGFAGLVCQDMVVVSGDSSYTSRMRVTMDSVDPSADLQVSALDVDFSTGAPVVNFDSVCLGHGNVASSIVVLDRPLPEDCLGSACVLSRGMGSDGSLHPQSYQVSFRNFNGRGEMTFAHRGGKYVVPTEVFGPGVFYDA